MHRRGDTAPADTINQNVVNDTFVASLFNNLVSVIRWGFNIQQANVGID